MSYLKSFLPVLFFAAVTEHWSGSPYDNDERKKNKNNWSFFPKALSEEKLSIPIMRECKLTPNSLVFKQPGTYIAEADEESDFCEIRLIWHICNLGFPPKKKKL